MPHGWGRGGNRGGVEGLIGRNFGMTALNETLDQNSRWKLQQAYKGV